MCFGIPASRFILKGRFSFCLSSSSLPPVPLLPPYLVILWFPPLSSQLRAKSYICSSGLLPLVILGIPKVQSPSQRWLCQVLASSLCLHLPSFHYPAFHPSLPHFLVWNNEATLTPVSHGVRLFLVPTRMELPAAYACLWAQTVGLQGQFQPTVLYFPPSHRDACLALQHDLCLFGFYIMSINAICLD